MITRMDPHGDGSGYDVYGSSGKIGEGIELEDGIKILTLNGAMAMMHEDETGSIETGKYADMIILDRNLFEIEETEISEVRVLSTVFQGEEVYQAP